MGEISFETFSRKTQNAANALQNTAATIVRGQSAHLASDVAQAYRVAAGGDGKLSGTSGARRKSGKQAAVSARAKDVRKYADGTYIGLVVPTGPYGLIEADIDPHVIAPFSYSQRKRKSVAKKARRDIEGGEEVKVRAALIALAGLDARQSANLLIRGKYAGFYKAVNHPGTKGRPVFSRQLKVSGPKVAEGLCVEAVKKVTDGYKAGR